MPYANPDKHPGICDRCGFKYKLSQLKYETVNRKKTGGKVCPDCWDGDHPQNFVNELKPTDPHPLHDPRPMEP